MAEVVLDDDALVEQYLSGPVPRVGLHTAVMDTQAQVEEEMAARRDATNELLQAPVGPGESQMLPRMPLLTQLTLDDCERVPSLCFLSTVPTLAHTLTHLQLLNCPITCELQHFSSLRALLHLVVGWQNTTVLPLGGLQEWNWLIPPSHILPNLREFEFVFILEDGSWLRSFQLAH